MMWIDGEYFETPIEALEREKKKAYIDAILKSVACDIAMLQAMAIASQPILPPIGAAGGIVHVDGGIE